MISKEELLDELREWSDGDLSDGTCAYLADHLLEKYVLFNRPDKGVVRLTANGGLILDGRAFPVYTTTQIEEWYEENLRDAECSISRLLEAHALLEHYRKEAVTAKAKRREEITKELGGDTFDELPPMVQKLVVRLVEAEFTNARD